MGIDYEEGPPFAPQHRGVPASGNAARFHRRTNLVARPLPGWLASVVAGRPDAHGLVRASFRSNMCLTTSRCGGTLRGGDASRFLRATLGVSVLLAGAGLWHMLGGAR